MADSACALENMMIAANALDLGSCWINQLHWLDEDSGIRNYLKAFGLSDEETITGGLILGYGAEETACAVCWAVVKYVCEGFGVLQNKMQWLNGLKAI